MDDPSVPLPAPLPPTLVQRYRQLFRFYDRQGDGELNLDSDFRPAATSLAARWQGRTAPFPDLFGLLMETYRHEQERRDTDRSSAVDEQEFVASHGPVLAAFQRQPEQARAFIARAAGGFFDVLDLDGDGCLQLADLEAYAAAYAKPSAGIAANLRRMLDGLELPPEQPREVFLTLGKLGMVWHLLLCPGADVHRPAAGTQHLEGAASRVIGALVSGSCGTAAMDLCQWFCQYGNTTARWDQGVTADALVNVNEAKCY